MVVYRLGERSRDSGPFLSVPKPGRRKSGCCFGAHGQMALAGMGVMAFVLAAAAFVIGVPTDQNVDRIIAGDNIMISPENGYGAVTIHSTGVGGNGVMGDNNVTKITAGDNIVISPENGYGNVTITARLENEVIAVLPGTIVIQIIAGENIDITPDNGYGTVTITAAGYDNSQNVQKIIAGENITVVPADGYGDVTITADVIINDINPLQLDAEPTESDDGYAPTYNHVDGSFTWAEIPDSSWTRIDGITLMSDNTNVNFYGLDMEADGPYMIYMLVKHATALNNDIRLFFNEDTDTSHYYVQQFQANATTISANRLNEAWIAYGDGLNSTGFSVLNMGKLVGGYPRTFAQMARPLAPASCQIANLMHIWDNTNNVTSITFAGRSADCIGAGSQFYILGMLK